MCGIAGFFDKSHAGSSPAGATLLRMLTALSCRGPDSAGIALWGEGEDGLPMTRLADALEPLDAPVRVGPVGAHRPPP